jgi:hypothetical protein
MITASTVSAYETIETFHEGDRLTVSTEKSKGEASGKFKKKQKELPQKQCRYREPLLRFCINRVVAQHERKPTNPQKNISIFKDIWSMTMPL